jgi:predicted nucleic-acid-binding protein
VIGVDTNVLVRHLVRDDPDQADAASRFLAQRTAEDPVFVSVPVLVELIWTLRTRYRQPADRVLDVVESLLASADVVVESAAAVRRAVLDALESSADLADAIIAHRAIDAGCDGIVTFDRRARRLPGMLPVDPR